MDKNITYLQEQVLSALDQEFHIIPETIGLIPEKTVCTVFRVVSEGCTFGVKVYPQQYTESEMQSEMRYIRLLMEAGVNVPACISARSGKSHITLNDQKKLFVFEWLSGESFSPLPPEQVRLAIHELAKMHLAVKGSGVQRPDDWMWRRDVEILNRISVPKSLKEWFSGAICRQRPWEAESKTNILIHNDVAADNIIWRDAHSPYYIDFTNSINAPPEWDIVRFYGTLLLGEVRSKAAVEPKELLSWYSEINSNIEAKVFYKLLDVIIPRMSLCHLYLAQEQNNTSLLEKFWIRISNAKTELDRHIP